MSAAPAAGATASSLPVSSQSPVVLQSTSDGQASINLSLHPLPILNVSEHLVAAQLQSPDAPVKIYGALLGTQSGRDIEIQNSFEFAVIPGASAHGDALVDHDFLKSRQNQFKQVFPTFDFLGWYSVGSIPLPADLEIHKQLLEYNEAPLFLQLSPSTSSFSTSQDSGELPVAIYESVLEMAAQGTGDAASMFFVRSPYRVATGEAERIAVDHASRPPEDGEGGEDNNLLANLTTQQNALKMLSDRIMTVTTYLQSVRSGALPRDEAALRQISALVACLPASNLPEFRDEFLTEYNDVLLTTQLASFTKGLNGFNELVDKSDVVASANDENSKGSRRKGTSGSAMLGKFGKR